MLFDKSPIFSHGDCSSLQFTPYTILCPTHAHKYPPFINDKTIEEYILNRISKEKPDLNFIYIPILWTNMIWKPNNEKTKIYKFYHKLINQLIQSNPSERFITICQNDDGPIFPIPNNTIVWGGSVGHIPMPLIYEDKTNYLENLPKKKFIDKSILCSFVGSMTTSKTSKVREIIHDKLKNNKNFYFSTDNWQLEVGKKRQQDFVDITLDSKFCLAPRGYGRSSFRFFEAFLLKSIPIYIWDDIKWLPYKERIDYDKFCIVLNITDIDKLESILINIDEEKYQDMWKEYEKIKHYFTLDGLYNYFISFCKTHQ